MCFSIRARMALLGLFVVTHPIEGIAQPAPDAATLRVRLLAPVSTKFSRKGDVFAARVIEPASFQGGTLEGEIRDVRAGGGSAKTATVQFEIHTLHLVEKAMELNAGLVETINSRGQSGVDEEGAAVEGTGRAAVFSRSSGPVRLTVKADNVSFAPGSIFVVRVQFRKTR